MRSRTGRSDMTAVRVQHVVNETHCILFCLFLEEGV